MAFAQRAEVIGSGHGSFIATHTVTMPTSRPAGGLVVVELFLHASTTITGPASHPFTRLYQQASLPGQHEVWARILDGTEPATLNWTSSTSQSAAMFTTRFTGHRGGLVAGTDYAIAQVSYTSNQSTINPAAVTAPWGAEDNLFMVCAGYNYTELGVSSYPASYSGGVVRHAGNVAAGASVAHAFRELAAASDDPGVLTLAGSQYRQMAATLVLRPAGSSITPARAVATVVARQPTIATDINVTPVRAVASAGARLPEVVRPPRPLFPAATLDVAVEAAFGAGSSNPMEWAWTDLSDRLLAGESAMTVTRGRPDEKSQPSPSNVSTVLDNGDGALTPRQPGSPYWPDVRRNTPLRVSAPGRTPALDLPGVDGAYASTPYHPDFEIGGTIDLRVRLEADQWSTGRQWTSTGQPLYRTYPQLLVGMWDVGDLSWAFDVASYGVPTFSWVFDQASGVFTWATATDVAVAALGPVWLAATFTPDLAGQIDLSIYTHPDTDSPAADLDDWTFLGANQFATTTSIDYEPSRLTIGSAFGAGIETPGFDKFRGRVLAMQLRDGRNGTLVANPDFTAAAVGNIALIDSTGKTWSVHGDAEISLRHTRFVGSIDEWDPTWPHGDNEPLNPSGIRPSESRVHITASGILRRLSQGAKALRSPLRRHATGDRYADQVVAYWPLEDADGAVNYGSAVAGERPLAASGLDAGSDTTLPASGGLPTIRGGEVGYWYAVVPTADSSTAWTVDWVFRIPTPESGGVETPQMTILTAGTASRWEFSTSENAAVLRVYGPSGNQLASNATGIGSEVYDGWVLAHLEARQNGSTIDWSWALNLIDIGTAYGSGTQSFTGTLGTVNALTNTVTAPPDGISIGHFIVTTGLFNGWLAGADTAWVGESAAHRIFRLCNEEGIPVEIVGDPAIESAGLRGDLTVSEPMGPQRQLTFLDLLQQCVDLDLGVLAERPNAPGFTYRCRGTLENQSPAMALDAAADNIGDIVNPFEPTLDDPRFRNDVEVVSTGGSSARVRDAASITAEGLYDTSVEVAGVGGVDIQLAILNTQTGLIAAVVDQNLMQAGWRLHLGTSEDMRYPTVEVDLAIALAQIDAWLDTRLGDRVTVDNLPVQHPALTVELVVEAISESLRHNGWEITLTCSPGGPWLVGVLDE